LRRTAGGGQVYNATGFAQGLPQGDFLCCFVLWESFRWNPRFQHSGYQAAIAGVQTGIAVQGGQRSLLVLSPPGRVGVNRIVGGGQRDQPEIKVAVQLPPRQQRQFQRKLQGFRIPTCGLDFFAQSRDSRQPTSPPAMPNRRRWRDPQTGITTESAE